MEWIQYKNYFDIDYYETRGYKSGYESSNYTADNLVNRIIPELIKTVFVNRNKFPLNKCLDFGCSFGWMVKSMIEMDFNCFGQDISSYAIDNADTKLLEWERVEKNDNFEVLFGNDHDLIFSVDTLDRIPDDKIDELIANIYNGLNHNGMFFGIWGLGHNNDRGSDLDQCKQLLQPRDWWVDKFKEHGFIPRLDIEACVYETDVHVDGMDSGSYVARENDWNVFVFQTGDPLSELGGSSVKIYDRSLISKDSSKPTLLFFGKRHGEFYYPDNEFFQIDNWGNYLSYFLNGQYRRIEPTWDNKLINSYDLVICALELDTVTIANEIDFDFENGTKSIAFLDGLLSVMSEKLEHNRKLIELANKFDVVLSHQPHAKEFAKIYGIETIDCSHIFPLRYFDLHYNKKEHDGFNIYCTGMYGSTASLSSFSLHMASKYADKVFMVTHEKIDNISFEPIFERLPENCTLLPRMKQSELYSNILSQTDLIIRMDNIAGVGRAVAEGAAAGIPCISTKDLYQMRCFPELMVNSIDEIGHIESLIVKLKEDQDFYNSLSVMSRDRLIASNKADFNTMLNVLLTLGFDFDHPNEVYW